MKECHCANHQRVWGKGGNKLLGIAVLKSYGLPVKSTNTKSITSCTLLPIPTYIHRILKYYDYILCFRALKKWLDPLPLRFVYLGKCRLVIVLIRSNDLKASQSVRNSYWHFMVLHAHQLLVHVYIDMQLSKLYIHEQYQWERLRQWQGTSVSYTHKAVGSY